MSGERSANAAGSLSETVGQHCRPRDAPFHGHCERDGRIQVRARDRLKCRDQRDQRRARCDRVGEQRQSHVAAGKSLRHDSRTDHRGNQKTGSEEFRGQPPREREAPCLPMSFNCRWMASRSRLESGRLRNRLILRSSITNASRKAFSISSGVPSAAAGSSTPQCAVIGCPGHTGQISLAALSQTVKTKFIFGAPGAANSFQLLLRSPAVDRCAFSSCSMARGFTTPVGWLPALYAVKLGRPLSMEDRFGHLRPRGVAGAKEQDVISRHGASSPASRPGPRILWRSKNSKPAPFPARCP